MVESYSQVRPLWISFPAVVGLTHAGELSTALKINLKPSLQITEVGSTPIEICFNGELET